jgi:hypothetical protein
LKAFLASGKPRAPEFQFSEKPFRAMSSLAESSIAVCCRGRRPGLSPVAALLTHRNIEEAAKSVGIVFKRCSAG